MSFEEWKVFSIGQLGQIITGKTPPTADIQNFGGVYPFITIPDLDGRVYITTTQRTLSRIGAKKQKSLMLPPNTVMISCIATVGKCGITTKPSFTNQQINSVICDLSVTDPIFLYYTFCGLRPALEAVGGGGSVYTNISKSRFSNILIALPPLVTQRRIAEILSALDDKIELNRQTNATLEAIAQAIFKEWFVNFNFPGATGEMVDSELGMIPKGWRAGRLGEVCELIKGVSYSSTELQPSNNALVTLKSINRKGGFNSNGFKEYTGRYKSSQCLDEGDLIFAQTDITQNAEVIGSPAIVENPFEYEKLIASLDIVKCIPSNEMPSSQMLFYFLQRQVFKDYCLSQTNGSTVLHLRSSEVPNYQMIIPSTDILRRFDTMITSLRQKILINNRQNHILSKLSNYLLPKLMTGEVSIET